MRFKSVLPFASNAVSTAAKPVSFIAKSVSQQAGFFHYANTRSDGQETEKKIVEEAASYGRQLRVLTEMMAVLVAKLDLSELSEQELSSIGRYTQMIEDIDRVKQHKTVQKDNMVDRLIDQLQYLERSDRQAYEAARRKLSSALED